MWAGCPLRELTAQPPDHKPWRGRGGPHALRGSPGPSGWMELNPCWTCLYKPLLRPPCSASLGSWSHSGLLQQPFPASKIPFHGHRSKSVILEVRPVHAASGSGVRGTVHHLLSILCYLEFLAHQEKGPSHSSLVWAPPKPNSVELLWGYVLLICSHSPSICHQPSV